MFCAVHRYDKRISCLYGVFFLNYISTGGKEYFLRRNTGISFSSCYFYCIYKLLRVVFRLIHVEFICARSIAGLFHTEIRQPLRFFIYPKAAPGKYRRAALRNAHEALSGVPAAHRLIEVSVPCEVLLAGYGNVYIFSGCHPLERHRVFAVSLVPPFPAGEGLAVCREGKVVLFVKRYAYAAVLVVFQLKLQQYVRSAACAGAQRSSFHAVEDNTAGGGFFAVKTHQVIVDLLHVLVYFIIILPAAFLIFSLRRLYHVRVAVFYFKAEIIRRLIVYRIAIGVLPYRPLRAGKELLLGYALI